MTNVPSDVAFLQWLIDDCGYRDPKPIPGNRYACIQRKLFTHAITTGMIGDRCCIDQNWCYQTYSEAKVALDAWDGIGEPQGWFRATHTGERVSLSADEIDGTGKPVGAIGVRYVRL